MARYLKRAFRNFSHGVMTFVRPVVCENQTEDIPPPQSIDRYFARVGERLIRARNRFEREYMGVANADA